MLIFAAIYLIIINLVTWHVYADDHRRARRGRWRTPESTLILLPMVGGSIGAILAMIILRHKTNHTSFLIGIPTILIIQLLLVVMIKG